MDEVKQVRSKYSYQVQTLSGVSTGGITSKGVNPHQPDPMREAGITDSTHMGVHHAPNGSGMDHISPVTQRQHGHLVDRYA